MSPLLNRANISSTYGSKVAALRRQANASSGGGSIPDGDAVFYTAGSAGWICPAGVTAARVVVIGAGGGAGTNGGGGGGGAAMRFYTNLVPGTTYALDVGSAGDENRNGNGLDGGASRFYGPGGVNLEATGGTGGAGSSASGNVVAGGQGTGGQVNGTGGKGYPSANDPMGAWGWPFVPSDDACGSNGAAGGGGYGADNGWAGHGGSGSMYAGGGGGGGSDNECGGDGGPGGELAIGGYTQRGFGGGGGGTDGSHLSSDTRDGSGGGTLGGYGGVYGGNTGENKDSAVGGSGGNYGGTNGGLGGTGSGQQAGGGGGGSFGGGGAPARYGRESGGGGGDGLVYIKHGKDFDGTDVGAHYPVATTFNGRFEKIYHTCNFTNNNTSQVRAPYGIRAGDLLILMEYGPDVTSSITGNIPSGFTLCSQSSEHAAVDQRLFYRVADGTEGGNNYYGQVGSNVDTHLYVFRGPVPLNSVSEQQATYSDNQTGSGCALSMTLNQPSAPYSPYVFSVWSAGTRSSNNMYISGTNPASTSIGEGGGNGWYHNPSIRGKGGDEAECFSWRIDDTSGGSVNRNVAWTYGSTSRNTSLAMALNLDFTPPPAGQALLNTAGNATTWTCPAGVTRVSVVCIGAGGGWTDATGDTTITFDGSVTLTAGGGKSRNTNASAGGSSSGGDENWTGGMGASSSYGAGGGGAAGYSGNGQTGGGGSAMFANDYPHGSGAGAGGGSYTGHQNGDSGGKTRGGGGVGVMGKGADATDWGKGGSGGADSQGHNGAEYYGGGGGVTGQYGTRSGGGGGLCWKNSISVTPGTTYNAYIGGGGNGGSEIGAGGHGAIRIIWGYNRTFPNNNTADV